MDIEQRLSALGLELPAPPTPAGNYVGSVRVDNLLFVGGNVGRLNGEPLKYTGQVGSDVTLEQAYEMARRCALNHLAAIKAALGDLDRVGVGSRSWAGALLKRGTGGPQHFSVLRSAATAPSFYWLLSRMSS